MMAILQSQLNFKTEGKILNHPDWKETMPTKILVVDDEPDLEHLIQKFRKEIRQKQFQFIFAHNGFGARKLQAEPDIDIVLTDIYMPEMDGLTLLS